jgi:hypothetical protein
MCSVGFLNTLSANLAVTKPEGVISNTTALVATPAPVSIIQPASGGGIGVPSVARLERTAAFVLPARCQGRRVRITWRRSGSDREPER